MTQRSQDPAPAQSNRFFRALRLTGRWLFHILFSIRVEGLSRLPAEGGYVLVCNHLSWFDPLLLLISLPPEPKIHFLAAQEYTVGGKGLVPWIIRHAGGVIPVDRKGHKGDRAAVVQSLKVLRSGGVLGIFPEGGCGSEEGRLQPLKLGAATFAVKTGKPVVVLGLSGTSEIYLRRRICLRVGPTLMAQPGEDAESLLERIAIAMAETIPPLAPQPRRKHLDWLFRRIAW